MSTGPASSERALRVGVLDDHRAFADALCMAMNATDDIECVGIAGSMNGCLELATSTEPDVLVVDYQLLDGDGLRCAEQLEAAGVRSALVMLTAHASTDLAERARAAGIAAFVPKDSPLADVLDTIRSAGSAGPIAEQDTTGGTVGLSRRQREVLELLGAGFGPAEIAEQLFVSIHTARGHVKDILKLMGASTQLEAVTTALRRGYLIPPRVENDPDA